MDLESESSALESVEDNGVVASERSRDVEKSIIRGNGSSDCEHDRFDVKLSANDEGNDVGDTETVNSPPVGLRSPSDSVGSASPAPLTKGYGLKKWRRIRRDVVNDGSRNVDTTKIMKRVLSTSVGNSSKPQNYSSIDRNQRSEGSVSSTNGIVKSPGIAIDGVTIHGSSLDPHLGNGPVFAAGMDSENSEDRSSKSSTAASVPKMRYDMPMMRDKIKLRSPSGKNLGNAGQRGQQGKARIETSKKARGERVNIEKENSHSSMESDSRSSNFVFMQASNSITSNGKQSAKSMNYDRENSDEAQGGDQQFSEELQAIYGKENVVEYDDLPQEYVTPGKREVHGSFSEHDAMVEPILNLQSAQEALEKELVKLREIGKEQLLPFDDTTQFSSLSSASPETQVISLRQNIDILQNILEETKTMLKAKEARVVELETTLESDWSPNKNTGSSLNLQQEKNKEMEAEIEGLFTQKIEAEVEYLVISRIIQKLKLDKPGDDENKVAMLEKRQAEKSKTGDDIVEIDEVLKLQNRVCKTTSCLVIQLILLVVVLALFMLQLSPHDDSGVVPT